MTFKLPEDSIFRIPLVKEITFILILKLIVIFTIKHYFFSDPVDMSHPEEKVMQKFGIVQTNIISSSELIDVEKAND